MRFGNNKRAHPNSRDGAQEARGNSVAAFGRSHRLVALEAAVQRAEKAEEFRAQHGPVKILFKDFKAVPQE